MAETQYWRGFLAIFVNCSAIGEKPSKELVGRTSAAPSDERLRWNPSIHAGLQASQMLTKGQSAKIARALFCP